MLVDKGCESSPVRHLSLTKTLGQVCLVANRKGWICRFSVAGHGSANAPLII